MAYFTGSTHFSSLQHKQELMPSLCPTLLYSLHRHISQQGLRTGWFKGATAYIPRTPQGYIGLRPNRGYLQARVEQNLLISEAVTCPGQTHN
jgi:hypothetical protein